MRSRTARSGCDFTALRLQEFFNRRPHRTGESFHIVDRDIALATLHRPDIRAMQVGFFGKIFLRNSQRFSVFAQIVTENLTNVSFATHEFMLDSMMTLALQ